MLSMYNDAPAICPPLRSYVPETNTNRYVPVAGMLVETVAHVVDPVVLFPVWSSTTV